MARTEAVADALRIAEITARRSVKGIEDWIARRNTAIAVARQEGASLREIAEATELSHTAIQKILTKMGEPANNPA